MMITKNGQDVKILEVMKVKIVEINGITYTPFGKFNKPASEINWAIENLIENGPAAKMKDDYEKALDNVRSGNVPEMRIENEKVIFDFGDFKIEFLT